jgi:arylsulfatase
MAKANGKQKKPNILFIMADDIGWFNVSAYNHGIMGYRTPNIDRIAKEGAMFTDFMDNKVVPPDVQHLLRVNHPSELG